MTRVFTVVTAVIALLLSASPAFASSGLVGDWPLDEGAGTAVHDVSGAGNDGVLSGGATWVPALFGDGLSFDGQDGQVRVPDSASLEPTTAVSVSAWVKHAGSPGTYRYIVSKGATSCLSASYGLYTGPSGGLEFYVSQKRGTTYATTVDAGDAVWDGNWHLVTGTFDGSVLRLYVDGTEVGSSVSYPGALVYDLPTSNDFFIGNYPGCAERGFVGVIDDVMVWDRALTPTDVIALLPTQGAVSPPAGSPLTPGPGGGASLGGAGGAGPAGPSLSSGLRGQLPSITNLHVSGKVLTIGRAGTVTTNRAPRGLTITYTDSQGSRVTMTVVQLTPGVRVGPLCVSPRHSGSRHLRACTRQVIIGTFIRSDRRGRTTLRFTGLSPYRLVPGRYRLIMVPRSKGQVGAAVAVAFSVRLS